MNILLQYILGICAFSVFILNIHVVGSHVLTKTEQRWFSVASWLLVLTEAVNVITYIPYIAVHFQTLYSVLIIVSEICVPMVCMALCFACGDRKVGKAGLILNCLYTAVLTGLFFAGKLFTVDAEGNYKEVWLGVCSGIYGIIYTSYTMFMLFKLSRSFDYNDSHTLNGIVVLALASAAGNFIEADAGMIGVTFVFVLIYVYYSGLMQHKTFEKVKQLSGQTVQSVVSAIDAKDQYTQGHSKRVADYACVLAEALGYNEEQLEELHYAAALHDVGKIAIPDSVLNKAGRLSSIEYDIMKEHTVRGSGITKKIDSVPDAFQAAMSHHERYDGKGYPNGLAGKEIPEIARIIAIADTFDAMNSDRIYRKALPADVIRNEMVKGSGTQFDPDFVRVFVALLDQGKLDSIAMTGREDLLPEVEDDDFTVMSRDVLQFFTLKYEFTGMWDENFDKWEQLKDYIEKISRDHPTAFRMAVISITAAEGRTVSEKELETALTVMKRTALKMMPTGDVCDQISLHQLALIIRNSSEEEKDNVDGLIKDIFLYFYKISEAEPFKIDYRVVV